jgi:peptidyl-prolyl cis-trans isomerase A (cyclophilin A)
LFLLVPETFQVTFNTTKGIAIAQIVKAWAPIGARRFYELIKANYYNDNAFFRVILTPNPFVAQWGLSSNPNITKEWEHKQIRNDPVVQSNLRGFITYAAAMKNNMACCRTTQIYVNYGNNSFLDPMGFAPFAQVISGMEVFDSLYGGYGESPDQTKITKYGSTYLKTNFPLLDYLNTATFSQPSL